MEERDEKKQKDPVVMIVERRKQGNRELTSAEVMKIVRKRSGKKPRGVSVSESDYSD